MAEFLETIETIEQEAADVRRLFSGDGQAVRHDPRRNRPGYHEALLEAARLINDVNEGRRPVHLLEAAMTTSDFPQLFGDVLDRQLLASYQETEPTWMNYIRRGTVRDFRAANRFAVDGAEAPLDDVNERAPYPVDSVADTADTIQVRKLGRKIGHSWEAMINDDLGGLTTLPNRLARAARRTEEKEAVGIFVDANGPHASLYTAQNGNLIPNNPVFDIDGLKAGLDTLSSMTDTDGDPITIEAVELVVPPALEIPALEALNALQLEVQTSGSRRKLITANWMKGRVRLNVAHYIPIVASSPNGDTSWFLFASASSGRPAGELAFLRGHEAPQLFRKSPNAVAVGGGMVDPGQGDFDTDAIEFKVRHVLGSARFTNTGGWRATVASNGTGSS